jgi:hypothetical protein
MISLERTAGAVALLQAVAFLAIVVFNFALLPTLGLGGADAFRDPARVLQVGNSPLLWLSHLPNAVFSLTLVVLALALAERLRTKTPMLTSLSVVSAVIASAAFLALGMVRMIGIPELARLSVDGQAAAGPAYLALNVVTHGIQIAGIFGWGWWALLVGWAALRSAQLPRLLCYLGLLWGVLGILTFAVAPLSLVGVLVGLIWSVWLGVTLSREPVRGEGTALSGW